MYNFVTVTLNLHLTNSEETMSILVQVREFFKFFLRCEVLQEAGSHSFRFSSSKNKSCIILPIAVHPSSNSFAASVVRASSAGDRYSVVGYSILQNILFRSYFVGIERMLSKKRMNKLKLMGVLCLLSWNSFSAFSRLATNSGGLGRSAKAAAYLSYSSDSLLATTSHTSCSFPSRSCRIYMGMSKPDPYTAVMIVPTGIGASIGGYAGDALPSARCWFFCSYNISCKQNALVIQKKWEGERYKEIGLFLFLFLW